MRQGFAEGAFRIKEHWTKTLAGRQNRLNFDVRRGVDGKSEEGALNIKLINIWDIFV